MRTMIMEFPVMVQYSMIDVVELDQMLKATGPFVGVSFDIVDLHRRYLN